MAHSRYSAAVAAAHPQNLTFPDGNRPPGAPPASSVPPGFKSATWGRPRATAAWGRFVGRGGGGAVVSPGARPGKPGVAPESQAHVMSGEETSLGTHPPGDAFTLTGRLPALTVGDGTVVAAGGLWGQRSPFGGRRPPSRQAAGAALALGTGRARRGPRLPRGPGGARRGWAWAQPSSYPTTEPRGPPAAGLPPPRGHAALPPQPPCRALVFPGQGPNQTPLPGAVPAGAAQRAAEAGPGAAGGQRRALQVLPAQLQQERVLPQQTGACPCGEAPIPAQPPCPAHGVVPRARPPEPRSRSPEVRSNPLAPEPAAPAHLGRRGFRRPRPFWI